MPLKLQLGVSKKHGLPAYGSVGASCQMELEVDSSLLGANTRPFAAYVQQIYAACAQAVDAELTRQTANAHCPQASANGHTEGSSNSTILRFPNPRPVGLAPQASKPITARQLDYACDLAERLIGMAAGQLDDLVAERFNRPLAALSSIEGSQLISLLQTIHARQDAADTVDQVSDEATGDVPE